MSGTAAGKALPHPAHEHGVPQDRRRRDFLELGIGYGLILAALWTPRPWQFALGWAALAWVIAATIGSFDGWTTMGLRKCGFMQSLWVACIALLLAAAAVAVSAHLYALHAPHRPLLFVRRFWMYALWAFLQEFLLLDFFCCDCFGCSKAKQAQG